MHIRHQTPIYISHSHKVLIITIRKCATESVRDWKQAWRGDPGAKVSDCSYEDFLKYNKSYLSFALVRNPFDRAVSSWRRAKEKYTPEGRDGKFETDIWGDTPEHFENFLGEALRVQDPHWFPQTFWIANPGGSELIVNNLIHLERAETAWKAITWMTLLPYKPLPWKNKTAGDMGNSEFYSKRAEELVLTLYEDDFKLLEYPRDRGDMDWLEDNCG